MTLNAAECVFGYPGNRTAPDQDAAWRKGFRFVGSVLWKRRLLQV